MSLGERACFLCNQKMYKNKDKTEQLRRQYLPSFLFYVEFVIIY